MWWHVSTVLRICSLVCVIPTLCLLLRALGGITKDKAQKKLISKFKGQDSLTDEVVCVTSDFTLALSPPPMRPVRLLDPSRSPQLADSEYICNCGYFLWAIRSGLPVLQEKRKCLVISCFFVPYSRASLALHLFKVVRLLRSNPWLTYWPTIWWWVGELLSPSSFFFTYGMNTSTHIYTHIRRSWHTHTHV